MKRVRTDSIWLSKERLGAEIRKVREGRLGMSQQALGVALGYSPDSAQGTMGQIEAGVRAMPDAKLLRFARMAKVSLTSFMEPDVAADFSWQAGYEAALSEMAKVLTDLRRPRLADAAARAALDKPGTRRAAS